MQPRGTKYALSVLVWVALCGPANAQQRELQQGIQQYNAGNYRSAAASLSVSIQMNPTIADTHYHLANCYMQLGDESKALREYQLGLQLARSGTISSYCSEAISRLQNRKGIAYSSLPIGPRALSQRRSSVHCPVGTESHPGGVDEHKERPPGNEFWTWEKYYRGTFERRLSKYTSRIPEFNSINGTCEIYMSIDRNHKLRGRVKRSANNEVINAIFLDIIRELDGSPEIAYKFSKDVEGFNWTHGIHLATTLGRLRGVMTNADTTALLRNTNTNASLMPNGQRGTQGVLNTTGVQASTVFENVEGKIVSKKKKLPAALKATPLSLPDLPAAQEVTGQMMKKDVNGQVMSGDVGGQIKSSEQAGKSTSGKVLSADDPAQKDVSGQVVRPKANGSSAKDHKE